MERRTVGENGTDADDETRRRLARELHANVVSTLTARLEPMSCGPVRRSWTWLARVVDGGPGWAVVRPALVGALVLGGLRTTLRLRNLHDTDVLPVLPAPDPPEEPTMPVRSADGTGNDLRCPAMGSAGARFGRNVPLAETVVDRERMLRPNPRDVSRELMTRHEFIPASTLNLLAATWLQFMVHDWLQHGQNERSDPWVVPLAADDPWPHHPMRIARTRRDPTRPQHSEGPPSFVNSVTHWWDGSQIYGSDAATQCRVRSGERGRLAVGADGLLPLDTKTHQDSTAVMANYWVGLSLMHTLFTLEHNAICEHLLAEHPSWSDDELFHRARLVNTALMAKIHTVEWTPGILGHPTLRIAMNANWWGLFGERFHRRFGHVFGSELLSGIPGSAQDHFGVPRYNRFRQLLHRKPVETFEQLTRNVRWAAELRRVYDGDVDSVDLMTGLYAEAPPAGFGFSDTAFRIFILMASRRLNSDRFFTTDYRPEVYSEAGLRWVDDNGFASVLTRHFPDLAPALAGAPNPFAPWRRTA
jgi:Animal haem peroxidase